MSIFLRNLLHPYLAPAGDADGGGGAADRGDDFVPTPDKADKPAADVVDPNAAALEAEAAAAAAAEKAKADEKPDAKPDAKADEKADDKADKRGARIPLDRHEKILAREREQRQELEARLAKFEKGAVVAEIGADLTKLESTVLELDEKYAKALADGETKLATDLMRQIRQTERQINEVNTEIRVQTATAVATEQARYDTVLERIEGSYPQLNPDHDSFDKEKMGEVVEMKIFYERMRKLPPAQALQQAVIKVLGQQTAAQETATEVTPRVSAEDVAAARKKAAAEKAADATGKTPASTKNVGLDNDKAGGALTAETVMGMSQAAFAELPDDALSKLRGDTF